MFDSNIKILLILKYDLIYLIIMVHYFSRLIKTILKVKGVTVNPAPLKWSPDDYTTTTVSNKVL